MRCKRCRYHTTVRFEGMVYQIYLCRSGGSYLIVFDCEKPWVDESNLDMAATYGHREALTNHCVHWSWLFESARTAILRGQSPEDYGCLVGIIDHVLRVIGPKTITEFAATYDAITVVEKALWPNRRQS